MPDSPLDLYGLGTDPSPAAQLLSSRQRRIGVAIVVVVAAAAVAAPLLTARLFVALCTAVYLAVAIFKGRIVRDAFRRVTDTEAQTPPRPPRLRDHELPTYTVLVPLFHEGNVVRPLVSYLGRLDYPADKLEIFLLCETEDDETIDVIRSIDLPAQFRLVVCPPGEPRTKPRACNVGLALSKGDLCVIYDAEDRPDLDQLRLAAETFAVADERVVCLQARLDYHNHQHNWLTRFFTVEYNHWFDLLLPALAQRDMPIPLGGTSNHFYSWALRDLRGWDPYNVTEDADLGMRIYAAGGCTGILDSVTLEEACAQLRPWIRQRTRWLKGYLQSWTVQMRSGAVRRRGGWRGVGAMHLLLGGTPTVNLLNPIFWTMFFYFAVTRADWVIQLFPGPMVYIAAASLVVGNVLFAYLNIVAVVHRERWHLLHAALLTPLYWLMMSWATWRACAQLVRKAHVWEKTPHGLSGADTDPATMTAPAPVAPRSAVGLSGATA